jgi:hypothetical protein
MAYLNLDLATFFCEQLEELHTSDKTAEEKSRSYRQTFGEVAEKWFRELQGHATVKSDPSILLSYNPGRIAKLFRELISHQPKEDA